MPKLTVLDMSGKQVGDIELSESVFGITPNEAVLHEAVVMQQASLRRGTHATKNRAAVSGGGKKPWRQKGTGRARHGSIRSPLWVGGGTVFGPQPRSYAYKLPKKVRRLAIKSALSSKVNDSELIVLDELKMEQPKTREMVQVLKNLGVDRKALIVADQVEENAELSARNIPGVKVIPAEGLNVLDVLYHDKLILTRGAVNRIEEVFGQ
ncbi:MULTISPECIES: 50S ribosomal protein L4 [Thermoactinomyces]|jgi:large subunit ribosomal protein L4|uniref:Large ribosomal subunit protein uL4 n=1 Tax=Thermoactinomyces vulgaris TaxID=2026 RepID=A0ABS0QJG4_THEVU|nr:MULTISPECIES: 50S ribosomal protein L4 [Thermoactinomyces]KFZ39853.1 50S ribosomal protein L4 [Thermoactinomyces sp. Gus2-1]KYQ85804.1 50S ribosomal protein L4 [Thermoactinomyces sp. AS95]MBA4552380.1 50S ribosomal protein L4 [Thermoactinomyces vulgaris]MBA4596665.1 50S ribosomal protein L4 [Thermoactinomyces vulgaris]MBH8584324.1 50S ribosomal protein L4 [Thermoactinomyces sp. CICC 10735]